MPYTTTPLDGSDRYVLPPPSYRTSQWIANNETTPLLSPDKRRPSAYLVIGPLGLCFTAIFFMFIGYVLETPLDSSIRQRTRIKWAAEERSHGRTMVEWDLWVRNMTLEKNRWLEDRKAREEQDRREEEERVNKERVAREAIEWQDFQRFWCVGHGKREYRATLANVPVGFNAMDECSRKTMDINGKNFTPVRCEDQGYCGKVIAHFEADYGESACSGPFFSAVHDKGCVGGSRRYDGKIDNIIEWYSWREVCSTMTALYGNVYLGPGAACSECNHGGCGYWATWLIDDWRCHS